MGYVAKALVYRDWYLLWMHSLLFEVIEISAAHLLPNFQECYWDRLLLDVFGANLIGMVIGMYLVEAPDTTHWWSTKYAQPNDKSHEQGAADPDTIYR